MAQLNKKPEYTPQQVRDYNRQYHVTVIKPLHDKLKSERKRIIHSNKPYILRPTNPYNHITQHFLYHQWYYENVTCAKIPHKIRTRKEPSP